MVNMKQYALAYLKYGIAIVPLHNVQNGTCTCLKGQRCGKSSGKHPRLTNWQGNWSRDPKQIEKWWTTWPDANIGMVTGKASGGICVVDVDEEIGRTNLKKYVNGLKVPVAGTARTNFDGEHWYFRTDKDVPDRIKGINGLDFRNSGIIVLPPSQGLAKRYKWKASLKGIEVPDIPDKLLSDLTQVNVSQSDLSQVNVSHATNESFKGKEGSPPGEAVKPKDYIKALYKFISNTLIFKDNSYKIKDHYLYRDSGTCTLMFTDGRRENDLFSLANALVKAGKDRQFIMEVMTRVMFTCHDVDPSFILRKIDNAVTRHGEPVPSCTIEDNPVPSVPSVPGRVREYVGYAEGTFSTSDVYRDLGLVTATDKTNCRKTLGRLMKDKVLEPAGSKSGHYRKVQNDLDEIDWQNAKLGNYYNLKMPLGLHEKMNFYPKGIMVIAGSQNAGKTAFAMRMALMNDDKDVSYFNSEMGPEELAERIDHFDHVREDWSHVKFFNRNAGFHDVIRPNGLNIIDFLEIGDNFYQIGEFIRQIHDKLDKGVAVICLQKKKDAEMGRGAEFGLEKPRIYISMDFGKLKIVKCKSPKHGLQMNGMEISFKLVHGANFIETEAS